MRFPQYAPPIPIGAAPSAVSLDRILTIAHTQVAMAPSLAFGDCKFRIPVQYIPIRHACKKGRKNVSLV